MTTIAEPLTEPQTDPSVLVSAPAMKFAIGLAATLSAVFFPRLVAALTASGDTPLVFVSREFFLLALSFSTIVAVAVMFFEWRVPRSPRDTFMTTLGLPAMLAGALSASQGSTNLQQAADVNQKLTQQLQEHVGIPDAPAPDAAAPVKTGTRNGLSDLLVAPVYAASADADVDEDGQQGKFGIYVAEPLYLIALDRAAKREDAQARATNLAAGYNKITPQRPISLVVYQQGSAFYVVVSGAPRTKANALLEAVRIKDTYHANPSLVEVPAK